MIRNTRFTLGAATALAILGAVAAAKADGQPVISLEPMVLGRTGLTINSNRPSALTTLPVRRIVTNGENTDIEYDTSAQPSMVMSRPVARVVESGENVTIEYDDAAAASMPHTMPNVDGNHNAPLWNLMTLPPSIR